ncbi:MAG: SpoIIE family protein phosphatase [Calditrichaceae bacterium]|nr:SpoIIE family protein phosphatase [Calditrichaceae bacterium]MBN2710717.1 SpoIIE family protein phosphatase [Calditrichaceae bacterium]RQV92746.1 MAG: GAF domain-containing protein [Calditrichota bacterium]
MAKSVVSEIEYILSYYRQLFNYQSISLFPAVTGNVIKPLLVINGDKNLKYDQALEIQWINFYQNMLTRETMPENSALQSFFKYFELDIILPIRDEKRCFGFLGLSSKSRKITEVELRIADFIMHYLSELWKNVELLYDIKRESEQKQTLLEEMTVLMEISRAIDSGRDIQNLLEFIMDQCVKVIRAEAGSILLMSEDETELEFKVALGPKGKEVKPFKVEIGKGIAGWVAEKGKPLLIPDAYSDKRFDSSFDAKTGFKTKSILCVPLIYKEKILGVVQALNRLDGKEFNKNDEQVFTIFATQAALAIENSKLLFREIEKEAIEKDLQVAAEIHRLIIPSDLPQNYGLQISGKHIPSQQVGGDFYSVFPINDDEIVVCIADVAGKGVSGALLVSTLHATLKAYFKYSTDIQEIVNSLNSLIMEISTSDKFITLFLGKYHKNTSLLEYINAGHNPGLLLREDNTTVKLKSKGISIGIIDFSYKAETIQLREDDVLILYTDGITETANSKQELYGEERLLKTVLKHRSLDCYKIQEEIIVTLDEFRGSESAADDQTLLVIKKN